MSNPSSIYNYEIIGEISIPQLVYSHDDNTLQVHKAVDSVFYDNKLNDNLDAPDIVPGLSAFYVRLTSGNRVVSSFIAIVTRVRIYKITLFTDSDTGCKTKMVNLDFEYIKLSTDYRNPDVPNVAVQLKDIIHHGKHIALFLAGSDDAVKSDAERYRVFCHNNKVYHSYALKVVTQQIAIDVPGFTVATIIMACEQEIPDIMERKIFDTIVEHYVNQLYRNHNIA